MNKVITKIIFINLLTTIRLIGVIALIPVYQIYGGTYAFFICAICFLTDFFDGLLARKYHVSTFFGSIYDCITDKAFLIMNMILLLIISPISLIPVILEVAISITQLLKYYYKLTLKTSIIGKLKMWVAGLTITFSYLLIGKNNYFIFEILIVFLSLSEVITLIYYIKELILQKDNIKKDKSSIKNKISIGKISMKDMLFSPSVYDNYKEYGNIKLLMSLMHK